MPKARESWEPTVSVVLAARNEEAFLHKCLSSLVVLDYPHDKIDLVIVNDASTDQSAQIIDSFANRHSFIRHIKLANGEKEKAGKAGALLVGIEKSRGQIIFFTDADCIVPSRWIREMLKGFRQNVGVVGGFTLLGQQRTIFEKIQALDWHFLLSIAAAASNLNKPITWVGNNLAVRRSAYEHTGGYRHIDASFVEDFALIDAIEKKTPWICRFYASPACVVRTFPAQTVARLYSQRKRWSMGIASARPFGWWIMATGFALHILFLITALFSPLSAVIALSLKIGIDALIFRQSSKMLQEPIRLPQIIVFEIFYILSSILLPILIIFDRRVSWKGAEL